MKCILCEKPSPKTRFAGIYVSPDGKKTPYILCKKCATKMVHASAKERNEIFQIVEASIEGGGARA